jgi:periplasmic protein CpxP/Spy
MMKKMLMFLGLVLAVGVGSFAQPQGGNRQGMGNFEERQKQQMETMKKELNLTSDQVTKIEALQAETNTKTRAIFESGANDREANREKMRAVREDHNKKLKSILTKDQATKWDEITEKMRAERRANAPGGGPQGGGQRGGERGGPR